MCIRDSINTNHNIVSVADLSENVEEFVFVKMSDKEKSTPIGDNLSLKLLFKVTSLLIHY